MVSSRQERKLSSYIAIHMVGFKSLGPLASVKREFLEIGRQKKQEICHSKAESKSNTNERGVTLSPRLARRRRSRRGSDCGVDVVGRDTEDGRGGRVGEVVGVVVFLVEDGGVDDGAVRGGDELVRHVSHVHEGHATPAVGVV